jgi:hypothetical protein
MKRGGNFLWRCVMFHGSKSPSAARTTWIGLVGATLLVSASAGLGGYYAWTVGSHQHVLLGVVFAAAAVGGEVLKPFAVREAIEALGRWQFPRALACLLFACVCIIYNLAAEIRLTAGSQGDLAASRGTVAESLQDARTDRKRAASELDRLPAARPMAAVQADIDAIERNPNILVDGVMCGRVDGKWTRDLCPRRDALIAERAGAQRRAELEQAISRADSIIREHASSAVKDADPGSATLAIYAKDLGYEISADDLSRWLVLIPVLFFEIGSSLAVLVVTRAPAPSTARPAPGRGSVNRSTAANTASPAAGEPVPAPSAASDGPPEFARRIAELVACGRPLPPNLTLDDDGFLHGTQRCIASATGYGRNVAKVNRHLKTAEKLGLVDRKSSPAGTAVRVRRAWACSNVPSSG